MTFTSPTDDILFNSDGTLMNFLASGALSAGQCVTAGHADGYCELASVNDDACIGVVVTTAAHGKPVSVAGPGCIVRCIVAGTSKCTIGDDLMVSGEGKVANETAGTGTKIGIALETQATADGTVKVLLC